MRLFLLLIAKVLLLASFGQPHKPQFTDYPVAKHFVGRQAAPLLTPGTAVWHFRTRIREAARQKPNFAGHYVLATWGCGAECVSSAIIDVETGTVTFDDVSTCCWFSTNAPKVPAQFEPVAFQLHSRLIIFTGLLGEEGRNEAHYFKFERGKLVALR